MNEKEHEFRKLINSLVKFEKDKTELEFSGLIRKLRFEKGWTKYAIREWILTKTIERLLSTTSVKTEVKDV